MEGGAYAVEDAEGFGLEGADAAFGGVAEMYIQGHELESVTPVFCNGTAVFLASLVVEDLVVNGVSTLLDIGHDAVVRPNAVLVIAGTEGINNKDVAVTVICQHDVLVATVGAKREANNVFSVELDNGINAEKEFVGAGGWEN